MKQKETLVRAILWLTRKIYMVILMTRINFSYIFEFCPGLLTHSSQNPWKFLGVKGDKGYLVKVTSGPHLMTGAQCQGNQPPVIRVFWGLEASTPSPDCSGRERGWRLNHCPMADSLNQSCLSNRASIKPKGLGLRGPGWRKPGDVSRMSHLVRVWEFCLPSHILSPI